MARHAGVSKGAVSFAFNGRSGVSSDTRARIFTAATELGWQPSHKARSLSASRAFAFGLILARPPELLGSDPFFPAFIAGVETVLGPAGYSLVLQVVDGAEAEEQGYRRHAGDGRVDGVILTDLRIDDTRIGLLSALGLPTVTLERPDVESPFPAVCMDDKPGVREAVGHLVALGHTRIAHVSGPLQLLHSAHRRDAWAQALQEAGLAAELLVACDFTAVGGAAATSQLLDLKNPPSAIVYANDLMAIAGLAVANGRGVAVPRDLSIVGYDDVELAAYLHPSLSTVRTDPYRWGRAAATTLIELLAGQQPADVHLAPARFVARDSTGPAPDTRKPPTHQGVSQ
ncbi:MAG: LacI family transcriptional regulator [Actinomycetota bacterium]|nr:LacI family transcriptional regulator [Actinomycetota bacterium]